MSKVKIGFTGLSVPEQIERSRLITGKMKGNPDYSSPSPDLDTVDKATTALEDAYNASRSGDKVKTAEMRLCRKQLLFLINQEASYVQTASNGDEKKILGSGFDVVGKRAPHDDTAGEVRDLHLGDGSNSGKIKAEWNKATNAVIYVLYVATQPDFSDQKPMAFTTKTQKELGDFKPGTTCYVKVMALGRENAGPESEPASIIVR